jgi:microcin C transport system substrate-binding protein
MIAHAITAKTRDDMIFACRALDRVFRSGRYWIPHWYKPTHWIAYWDVFAWPDKQPRYGRGVPENWWADAAKATAIKKG